MSAWEALAGALAGVPLLDGARCKGRPARFDLDVRSDRDAVDWAVYACGACPALTACGEWLDGLPPPRRPSGVVAARLVVDPAQIEHARRAMTAELAARRPKPKPAVARYARADDCPPVAS